MPKRVDCPEKCVDAVFTFHNKDKGKYMPRLVDGHLDYTENDGPMLAGNPAFAEKSFGITKPKEMLHTKLNVNGKLIEVYGLFRFTWYKEDVNKLNFAAHINKHEWTEVEQGIWLGKRIDWEDSK